MAQLAIAKLEIAKLRLEQGDVLVLKVDQKLAREAVHSLRQSLDGVVPKGTKVMILEPGMELAVLTAAEIEARSKSAGYAHLAQG